MDNKDIDKTFSNLLVLTVGSCTCCTKTPVTKFHDAACPYRIAKEAADTIESLQAEVKELREQNARYRKALEELRPLLFGISIPFVDDHDGNPLNKALRILNKQAIGDSHD